jgi:hypothetical protein
MSERGRELAARKELLLARSRLHRLELQQGVEGLKRAWSAPRSMLSLAASPALRPLVLGAITLVLGRSRVGKLLRMALAALAMAKTVAAVTRSLK